MKTGLVMDSFVAPPEQVLRDSKSSEPLLRLLMHAHTSQISEDRVCVEVPGAETLLSDFTLHSFEIFSRF